MLKPTGVYADSFFSAHLIYAIDPDSDRVRAAFQNGDTVSRPRWYRLYESARRGPYYLSNRRRIYLDMFMRPGYPG